MEGTLRLVARLKPSLAHPPTRQFIGLPPELNGGRDTRTPMPWPTLLVIEATEDGIFLFRLAADGTFAGDTWHENIEQAKAQASSEYGDLVTPWTSVPPEVTDVLAFGLKQRLRLVKRPSTPRHPRGVGAAQDSFRLMLRDEVAPALRGLGLKGSGQEFSLPSSAYWALLGFQRDRYSDARRVRFTINATVVARDVWTLAHAAHPWIGVRPRSLVDYAVRQSELPGFWHERIGMLMPGRNDHWWDLEARTDSARLAAEIVSAVETYLLPAMRGHMT